MATSNDIPLGRVVVLGQNGETLNPRTLEDWVKDAEDAGWLASVDARDKVHPGSLSEMRAAILMASELIMLSVPHQERSKIRRILASIAAELELIESGIVSKVLKPRIGWALNPAAHSVFLQSIRGKARGAVDIFSHFVTKAESFRLVADILCGMDFDVKSSTIKDWYVREKGDEVQRATARIHMAGRFEVALFNDVDIDDWVHKKYICKLPNSAGTGQPVELSIKTDLDDAKSIFQQIVLEDIIQAKSAKL